MPVQVRPEYFDWGGAFQGGIERAHEGQRRNAMLDMDRQQVEMQQRNQAMREDEYGRGLQAQQARAQQAQAQRASRVAFMQQAGLPPEMAEAMADDPDAPELLMELERLRQPGEANSGFGNVNPGDYTPDSLAQYAQSKNYADLKRQYAPPNPSMVMIGGVPNIASRANPGQVTPLSTPQAEIDAAAKIKGAEADASATAQANVDASTQNNVKAQSLKSWDAALSNLDASMDKTSTGYVAGRLPAVTAGQQVADSSVAALAPLLKQIFRTAGEGTFTNYDQQLLLDMIPTRKVSAEARASIIANINAIVRAKLSDVPKVGQEQGGGKRIKLDASGKRIP